jgi:hypothetical protein
MRGASVDSSPTYLKILQEAQTTASSTASMEVSIYFFILSLSMSSLMFDLLLQVVGKALAHIQEAFKL